VQTPADRTPRVEWAQVQPSPPHAESGARILIVDDEPSITDAVCTALRYEGFDAREARSARDARRVIEAFVPDLMVLDVMLPDTDGFAFARELRATGHDVPIIFLTARDETANKLAGLTLGDDYVTKPFSLAEIVARIGNVLRRTKPADDHAVLRFDDVVLNEDTHEVRRGSERIVLTRTEFALLSFFMRNPRRVLSKHQIMDAVWANDATIDPNVVETYVSYLRKKLGTDRPQLIQTIRLVGYALKEPEG
jgi:two-component system OmpR family response regulator